MKFSAGLTILASLVSASPIELAKRADATPLTANITKNGNTGVNITVTNNSEDDIKIFTPGTVLDTAAVEKVAVFDGDNNRLPFDGVRLRMAPQNLLTDASFRTIKAGETITSAVDFAELHDLGSADAFKVMVNGGIPYAQAGSTTIAGVFSIASNTLNINNVNVTKAALTRTSYKQMIKRTIVQSDCKGTQNNTVTAALISCQKLARAAADYVSKDDKRLNEYFKSTTAASKKIIVDTFNKVASECSTRNKGVSKQYCSDVYKSCSPGVLAYTVPAYKYMVNCPLYFTALPLLTTGCHNQDQSTTTLHEMTHLLEVKGTLDYGIYGYTGLKTLTSAQNLNHADTYAVYANAVNQGKTC
ncbi:deuterolysin metalloprotease [Colletotrichum salicis]|uniref:Neutral protease 2 n=1 Tax=Colletotrichum salicis TaxID=1209931 RepID=A0A135V449_9PEZI|nr:deuterolysin metalloprotease [Colletotrichum salicis]